MYNAELKMKFLAQFTADAGRTHIAMLMFDQLEKFEDQWGADICTRSYEEVVPAVQSVSGIRTQTKHVSGSVLKAYARWCIENGVPGATDNLVRACKSTTGNIKQYTVANPAHLQRFLDEVFDPESYKTIDVVFRAYSWIAYAGVREEDSVLLTKDNLDFSEMVIRYQGREYPFYRESIKSLRSCADLTFFCLPSSRDPDVMTRRERRLGNELLRRGARDGISESPVISTRVGFSKKLKNAQKRLQNNPELDLKLTYSRIRMSGIFYRAHENELAGIPVDFRTKLDDSVDDPIKARRAAHSLLLDYNRWKEAYMV